MECGKAGIRAQAAQSLAHLVLHGFWRKIQLFGYLGVGHAVSLAHEEYLAAASGQSIYCLPQPCFLLRPPYSLIVAYDAVEVYRLKRHHFGMLPPQAVNAGIAHGCIEKRALVLCPMLPKAHEAVLHHVFGGIEVTAEIVGGIKAERAVKPLEDRVYQHQYNYYCTKLGQIIKPYCFI